MIFFEIFFYFFLNFEKEISNLNLRCYYKFVKNNRYISKDDFLSDMKVRLFIFETN